MEPEPPADDAATSGEPPLDTRYGIEFDFESVERLCAEHDLLFPSQ